MTRFDVRAWNLFAAIAVALPACGDAFADGDDAPGGEEGEDDDGWYDPCGRESKDGSLRCSEGDTYWGDGDGDGDGDYECTEHADCGHGSVCMDGSCVHLASPLPLCDDGPELSTSIPVPAEAEGAISLSRIDRNGDGTDELIIDTLAGLRLVDPEGGSVEALPVEVTLGGHATVSGQLDASTPDDVVLVDRVTGEMSLLRNDGVGGWSGPTAFGASGGNEPIVPADFDGDGFLDVYAGGLLYAGTGAGGFAAAQMLDGVQAYGPAVAIDADADVADELLTVREDSLATFWDLDWGTHPLEADDACPLPPTDLAIADVDGDGAQDVARLLDDGNGSVLTVFLAVDDFALPVHVGLLARHAHIEIGDLDGNGIPDVVAWAGPGVATFVYWNLLDPTSCYRPIEPIAIEVEFGDYDGDGRDDLAVTDGSAMSLLSAG